MRFVVLWVFAKVFSTKFGGTPFFGSISEQSVKVCFVKIFFHTRKSFLSRKFPLYGIFFIHVTTIIVYLSTIVHIGERVDLDTVKGFSALIIQELAIRRFTTSMI